MTIHVFSVYSICDNHSKANKYVIIVHCMSVSFFLHVVYSLIHIQAHKQGFKYPKQQFIIHGWYDDGWWIEHESERTLSCTQEEIAKTLEYTLATLTSEFHTNASLVTKGGLVSTVEISA